MPLLATFIGSLASGLAGFFARWIGYQAALKLASYVAWIATATAFLAATFVCVSSLYGMVSGAGGGGTGWIRWFWIGLGMFIPSNAAAVVSCIASVWIATSVWRIQRIGIENFSK
jgi:hypothetical protein